MVLQNREEQIKRIVWILENDIRTLENKKIEDLYSTLEDGDALDIGQIIYD